MSARLVPRIALAALLLAGSALAQETPPGPPVEGVRVPLEVRVERTIVTPGRPLEGAWAAFVAPGEGPEDAAGRAVATDPEGRCVVAGPAGGGVLLVWADDRAPVAIHARGALTAPLVLEPARDLTVHVRTPAGRACEGARVEVEARLPVAAAPLDAPSHHVYRVTGSSDADGAVVIHGLPDVNLRVRADAPGYVAPEVFPVRASDTPLTLDLRAGARVEGRATVIPGGGPAVGAVVHVGGATATVGADGGFDVLAVPPGTVDVVVEAADLVLREPLRLVLRDGERRAGVDLELFRTSVLSGRVVGTDGTTLEDADADLLWPTSRTAWSGLRRALPGLVTPGSDGRFRIAGLPPADGVALEVRAPGRAPVLVEGLSLVPGEQTGPLTIEMPRGALLAGRVVDAGGAAVSGARVEARPLGDAPARAPADVATTGASGVFLLDGLPPRPVLLHVVPPEGTAWRAAESGPFAPGEREAMRVGELVLRAGHALRGSVDGAPRDAVARVTDAEGDVRVADVVDGSFSVDGLPPGEARVDVASPSSAGGARAAVRLPAGWPLALAWHAAAPVTVRLRGAGQRAVTAAELAFEPRPTAAFDEPSQVPPDGQTIRAGDVDGIYTLALEPGAWRLTVRAGDLVGAAPVDVVAGTGAVVTLDLARGQTVRGFVGAADGGTPVEGARVVVEAFGAGGMPDVAGVTDARGLFEIDGVPQGVVRVTVDAAGHAPWRSAPLAVRAAETTDLGQIDLVAGGAVVGTVHDAYGTPTRGAAVLVVHEDGTLRDGVSDLHGRFRVEHLAPGDLTVEVAGVVHRVRLPLGARETVVRVRLGAGTVLRGRVTTDGRAEPYARIDAWTLGDPPVEVVAHTDGDGRFALPPLPPGAIVLDVLAAGAEISHGVPLELPDAAEDWIDIELPAGGVAGEVRDATGAGVPGARLWLWALDADDRPTEVAARGSTDALGRFGLERVAGGRYELEARREGHGEGRSAPFDVRSGVLAFGAVVDLPGEATLEAEIVDERGLPVVGGWLSALPYVDAPARVRTRARSTADGRAVLRSLAPGAYEVAVGGPGRGRIELGVLRVPEGRTEVGRVTLEPGGALRITALHPGYVPAARQDVRVEDLLGRDPRPDDTPVLTGYGTGATAADGSLLVGDLAPGFYRVGLAADDPADDYLVHVRPGEVSLISLWAPWPASD